MAEEIGVNVIFNGHIYHFDNDINLDGYLEQSCKSVKETDRENSVLYDDELNKSKVEGEATELLGNMREATVIEQKNIQKNIDSISVSTGLEMS